MPGFYDTWQEHCDYEANARYDYIREAYAATALDGESEAYGEYLWNCDHEGIEALSFEAWRAVQRAPREVTTETDTLPF